MKLISEFQGAPGHGGMISYYEQEDSDGCRACGFLDPWTIKEYHLDPNSDVCHCGEDDEVIPDYVEEHE
jgi:hypothetical protein